ncbi:unnamed protein product [Durusdinium trenchii]|uniref:Uncharacterized protein n=2 Tax=Durusdinium trenchii TaxID=1381693 RepID=A0ABP0QB51_9DINO
MAQPGRLSPQRMIPSEAEFPNGVSPRRRTALSIDRVGTKATELMGTARTRRGSLVPRPIGERTESPERSRMGRRMTRIKTQKFLGTDLRIPRGRAESLLYTYGEDDDLQPSSRRPSSLPGGLNSLESSGSGLGYYFKDKLKDLESAMQPELRNRALTEDLRRDLLALPKFKESKEMGHAVEEGYITEDFSRLIFDKFKNEAEPEFLQDLTLEVTGGLNMVAEIPLKEKYLWFIVLLVSVVFNVSYLLHLDWAIFKTYLTEVFGTFDPRLIADRLSNGGGSESRKEIQAQLLDDKSFKASIFGLISDQQTRMMIVNAAVMVAIWEVAWLCFQFVHALYLLGLVCLAKSEYKRFNAVGYFFQKLLPQVSTFSAVKLLARVHPSLLSHEYRIWVSECLVRFSEVWTSEKYHWLCDAHHHVCDFQHLLRHGISVGLFRQDAGCELQVGESRGSHVAAVGQHLGHVEPSGGGRLLGTRPSGSYFPLRLRWAGCDL